MRQYAAFYNVDEAQPYVIYKDDDEIKWYVYTPVANARAAEEIANALNETTKES